MGVGTGNLYGGWCVVVLKMVPKVVRDMAEIRYVVGFRTNLQLIVLKILSVVSCEERGFLFFFSVRDGFCCCLFLFGISDARGFVCSYQLRGV